MAAQATLSRWSALGGTKHVQVWMLLLWDVAQQQDPFLFPLHVYYRMI